MPLKVYIETTIPSFYHENRKDVINQARRLWTRRWWDDLSAAYNLCTSEAVLIELERPTYPAQKRQAALRLIQGLPILSVSADVQKVAHVYVAQFVMPQQPSLDALHLALASVHKCDILLTWNCEHLANARKMGHIGRVNERLGLGTPLLTTPMELLGTTP